MPTTSVILPMRNAEPWIEQTLQSLRSQKDADLEILVVDDGSTDRSRSIVESIAQRDERVRVLDGPQRGIAAAFNTALAAASGDYACRCDADDLYPHERLATQVAFLEANPSFVAVCGGYATVTAAGKLVDEFAVRDGVTDITDELLSARGRSHLCAYLFRTAALEQIGGCREYFPTSEDADLQFRIAGVGRVAYSPQVAYYYRLHDASITHRMRSARREFFERAAALFAEQRRTTGADDLMRGTPPTPPPPGAGDVHAHADALSTRAQVQRMLLGRAWKLHQAGQKRDAIACGVRALLARPVSLATWRSVAALVLKSPRKPAGTR